MIITEDIINNAVNESINEFLVNEALTGLNRGRAFFRGVGNGLKNMVYNYMDKKTNGEWNTKYGKYTDYGKVNGGTKLSWTQEYRLCQILSRWMDYHRKVLSNMITSQQNSMKLGNNNNNKNNKKWRNNNKNSQYTVITPEMYAKERINIKNFNNFAMKYFSVFELPNDPSYFSNYLETIQKAARTGNVGNLVRMLTYSYFYKYFAKNRKK